MVSPLLTRTSPSPTPVASQRLAPGTSAALGAGTGAATGGAAAASGAVTGAAGGAATEAKGLMGWNSCRVLQIPELCLS